MGAGVDYKEIQPDILSASFKSSLSEFGVPRQMGFTALSFQAFSSEGTLVVFRRCHGNVTQWKTMFLERTWENMGANRAGATIPVLRRCQTRWRSSLLSPWSLQVHRLRVLRVLRPPAPVVEVARCMTFVLLVEHGGTVDPVEAFF